MYKAYRRMFILIAILFCAHVVTGAEQPAYPPEVIEALDSAGTNRPELEKVLSHYASAGESLKLQAAFYLIGNMEGHCFVTYVLQDSAGAPVDFHVLDYPDYDALREACDTLEARHGELDFEKKEKSYDLQTITAEFLIEQIDWAFRAWRGKPWAKDLSFARFCDYVLPYRGSNEPLEPWRKAFWEKYADIEASMADPSDPIQAARLINDDIKSWFKFDPRYYYHPTDQGLAEMLQSYISRLEYDPAELDELERRLQTISKLKRRHDCDSLRDLILLTNRMREEYDRLTGSSGEKIRLEQEIERLQNETGNTAFMLSRKRSEAANKLERRVQAHLRDLGMSKAKFLVPVLQEEAPGGLLRYMNRRWKFWSTGVDKVEFLFSANVGEPPKPLRAIASGGEISRIMLALRTILADTDKVPVIIFDEIDAGVGASMGMAIAEKLRSVAETRQVICVTHLPQIAAMADNHIVVDKQVSSGRTRTEVSFPGGRDRVQEIARMLGGQATGQISIKHAQELLALSQKGR